MIPNACEEMPILRGIQLVLIREKNLILRKKFLVMDGIVVVHQDSQAFDADENTNHATMAPTLVSTEDNGEFIKWYQLNCFFFFNLFGNYKVRIASNRPFFDTDSMCVSCFLVLLQWKIFTRTISYSAIVHRRPRIMALKFDILESTVKVRWRRPSPFVHCCC